MLARRAAYTYTKQIQDFKNPRGGQFQAGLYPVSANVPLGAQTGATPDGRYAHKPVADGVSPSAGFDTHGPTASANSGCKARPRNSLKRNAVQHEIPPVGA